MLYKVSATGNDFILAPDPVPWDANKSRTRAQWAKAWCDRHEGLGADGAVFLEPHPQLDFQWDFYNSDGSSAEMCGNAARAVSLYFSQKTGRQELSFLTRAGVIDAKIWGPQDVEVSLQPILEAHWNQWSDNDIDKLAFDWIVAGVPHAVLRVPEIADRERLRALALEIKREPRFQKDGTNVTFLYPRAKDRLDAITFERGVEDFTLSCGTGAVAAAHSVLRGEEGRRLQVQVPGGPLSVIWFNGRPQLRGPAHIIAEIQWLRGG